MTRRIVFRIDENYMTLDRPATCSEFLRSRGFSRHLLTYLRHHERTLFLNRESVFTNHPVRKGDVLEVVFTDEVPSVSIVPNPMDLDIVYEDDDILVINKPPFLPVQPSIGHYEYTLGNGVVAYYHSQGIPFVYRCVNRLDRNTSGLVIIAKNMASSAILYDEMKTRSIRRTYLTVVHGKMDAPGTIDAPIRRRTESMIERCVDLENGQKAVTHFMPLSYNPENDTTALLVRLETGRTHQIRVHMAYISHPVAGDTLYGYGNGMCPSDVREPLINRQALHSLRLQFMHPITREMLRFEAPVPEDIRKLLPQPAENILPKTAQLLN
jgi:23S rRNA pseudouridine1911/1915/1917 synthase